MQIFIALLIIAKNWKQPRPSINKWLNCKASIQWNILSNDKEQADFCFQPTCRTETGFTFWLETNKQAIKYMKQQFARHWILGNQERWCLRDSIQMSWSLGLSQLDAWERFLSPHRERSLAEAQATTPWVEEAELRVYRKQNGSSSQDRVEQTKELQRQTAETCQRDSWGTEVSAEQQVPVKKLPEAGTEPPDRVRRNRPALTRGHLYLTYYHR